MNASTRSTSTSCRCPAQMGSALLLLAACSPELERDGTAIGNPTGMSAAIAPAEGIQFKSGSVGVGAIDLSGCDGSLRTVRVDRALDLLHLDRVALPAGIWCTVSVELTTEVFLSGNAQGGGTFDMTLGLDGLTLDAVETLGEKEEEYVLEFGAPGWTSADLLGLSGGGSRDIDVSSDEYDALVSSVSDGSELFVDDDGDGAVDTEEREKGAAAKSRGKSDSSSEKHSKSHADDTGG